MYHTRLSVVCDPNFSEILMAELAEADFDTFLETETGFEAYVEGEHYDKQLVEDIAKKYEQSTPLKLSFSRVPKKNWNEEWEKSYAPIVVEDKCLIRAAFHPAGKKYPYELVITPKMSFGTGHHQTTYLMVKNMMVINFKGKRVMDAGCGTAILSVMASKLGAREVEAFDIDEWSVVNGNENSAINGCSNVRIQQGKITEIDLTGTFDIILANINKNVLLEELEIYSSYLSSGGLLLLSGFLTHDIPDLLQESTASNLKEIARDERETWAALLVEAR
jgi:ribosomal protein L11 methyltransferase